LEEYGANRLESPKRATAVCLAAIVVMQVVNVFLCRDRERSAFAPGLASNRLLLAGIALELTLEEVRKLVARRCRSAGG